RPDCRVGCGLRDGPSGHTRVMPTTQREGPAVPMRPVEFDARFDDLPKHFAADGDIVMSHILAVLSSVFPDGEDYFVRAVERARSEITDPDLKTDVEGFIGQEE